MVHVFHYVDLWHLVKCKLEFSSGEHWRVQTEELSMRGVSS